MPYGYWYLPEAAVSSPCAYRLSCRDQKQRGSRITRVGRGGGDTREEAGEIPFFPPQWLPRPFCDRSPRDRDKGRDAEEIPRQAELGVNLSA